jgi:hypothetical protein
LLFAAAALCAACESSASPQAANFFPLGKNYTWTYHVKSKSQRTSYDVIDRVVGEEYVPALAKDGEVVNEFSGMERGGLRPLFYFRSADGYLSRISSLDYKGDEIIPSPWGGSPEDRFLPIHLQAGRKWDNVFFPLLQQKGNPYIAQHHRTFAESNAVWVLAGGFRGCLRVETDADYDGGVWKGRGMKLHYVDWYAPNVGLVKSLALEGGPGGSEIERVELMKYDVSGRLTK